MIEALRELGIVPKTMISPKCHHTMALQRSERATDGFHWYCNNTVSSLRNLLHAIAKFCSELPVPAELTDDGLTGSITHCLMDLVNRTRCRYCRLQKCLKLGMTISRYDVMGSSFHIRPISLVLKKTPPQGVGFIPGFKPGFSGGEPAVLPI
ncbi:hypothetical protein DMENIID0001_057400 [Sergentomyia squamirostris]